MSDDTPTRATSSEPASARTPGPATHEPGHGARRFGHLVTIVVSLALLYLANGLPNWNTPIITNDWPDVLWAVNLSLGATIVANLIFLAFDPWWFRESVQIALTGLSIIVLGTLYRVFPFDLGQARYDQLARLVLLVAILGVSIALIAELVSLARALARRSS